MWSQWRWSLFVFFFRYLDKSCKISEKMYVRAASKLTIIILIFVCCILWLVRRSDLRSNLYYFPNFYSLFRVTLIISITSVLPAYSVVPFYSIFMIEPSSYGLSWATRSKSIWINFMLAQLNQSLQDRLLLFG